MKNQEKPVVLMADDDDDDRMLARDAFEESRAAGVFHCVQDGTELLDYLLCSCDGGAARTPLPALILLDLNMPRKDGRQVLREIKSIPALRNIPIVVLTTSLVEQDIAFIKRMGTNAFIIKPVAFAEWIEMMKSLAEKWL